MSELVEAVRIGAAAELRRRHDLSLDLLLQRKPALRIASFSIA